VSFAESELNRANKAGRSMADSHFSFSTEVMCLQGKLIVVGDRIICVVGSTVASRAYRYYKARSVWSVI
jgi:hypothetical protein